VASGGLKGGSTIAAEKFSLVNANKKRRMIGGPPGSSLPLPVRRGLTVARI